MNAVPVAAAAGIVAFAVSRPREARVVGTAPGRGYGLGQNAISSCPEPELAQRIPDADPSRYNERFQVLFDEVQRCKHYEGEDGRGIDVAEQVHALNEAFCADAERIATLIVDQLQPGAPQRVPPALGLGGFAGGEKYLFEGIFFKLATDVHGLYCGDEYAAKAASHELNALDAVLALQAQDASMQRRICVAPACLIDYKGHRVYATAQLPLKESSLAYGSDDGTRTVHVGTPWIRTVMGDVCTALRLAPHHVGKDNAVMLGAADMEVHTCSDGRAYILDTARLFPPVGPAATISDRLTKLFRPEFLRTAWARPLSCDAFMCWGPSEEEAAHREDIMGATAHLLTNVLPAAARNWVDVCDVGGWGGSLASAN